MLYKNVQIHNVAELEIDKADGSMTWYRMPKRLMDKFEMNNARNMNVCATGVEIRFVIKSGKAVIRMKAEEQEHINNQLHIFRGSIQGGWTDSFYTNIGTEPVDVVIEKAQNQEALKAMSDEMGTGFDPEVIRIIFDKGKYRILDISGDIEPPKKEQTPQRTLLCYGSSITHGSNALSMSDTWAAQTAKNLDMDLINLGMAGSCSIEPDVIDYIADMGKNGAWDTAVMELGANVLTWDADKIRERAGYAITRMAKANPQKRIYVISPIYNRCDFHGADHAKRWRAVLEKTVSEAAFENVTYINGLELLGKFSLLSADEVHPSIYGADGIAKSLTEIIKKEQGL